MSVKGTRDYNPSDIVTRDYVFDLIRSIFVKYGAVGIDTPVFELKETLTNKYGEDSKLIYELKDQGGQLLALRYDLTVPFARYVAMRKLTQFKRYHIAKVYRRDQPNMSRGRLREFYQCDYDICGSNKTLLPDAECLQIMSEILKSVNLGKFTIRTSHRKLLDGFFSVCGVPEDKIRTISSAIDKLDKESWENVKSEMLKKGITEECADKIGEYVKIKGPFADVLMRLREGPLVDNPTAKEGIDALTEIYKYCEMFGCTESVTLDLSLARGLDYYTGVIYEAVIDSTVGTVAAGGRYDNLIGMFSDKQIPAVGFSIGVERLMTLIKGNKTNSYDIHILYDTDDLPRVIKFCQQLRQTGFSVSLTYDPYTTRNQLRALIKKVDDDGIPILCLFGKEIAVKEMANRTQKEFTTEEMF